MSGGARRRAGIVLTLLLLPAAVPAAGADPVVRGPPPPWVEPAAPVAPALADGAVAYELVDEQLRVGHGPPERYHHTIARALTGAGVPDIARLEVDLAPAFERVIVHAVRIHRGREVIDALDLAQLRKLRREEGMETDVFDGVVTAVQFIPDVRVGDAVEIAYTTVGQTPALGDGYAGSVALGWGTAIGHQLVRVIDRGGRLRFKVFGDAPQPEVLRRGEDVILRLDRRQVPAVAFEDRVPPVETQYPWMQLSTFRTWEEVARWAAALQPPADLSGAAELVERVRSAGPAAAEEAVRFVQDEIRYLGIEEGVSAHVPSAPARVLERRYGDCKEKSLLLASLLRELGIRAAPALVDVDDRGAVEERLPSPYAFDHAIVRAEIDGRVVWVDPTQSLERGPLAGRAPPPFARALVIASGVTGLEVIPEAPPGKARTVVTERFVQPAEDAPVHLDVESLYEGPDADETRRHLDRQARTAVQKRYLEFYEKDFPGVSVRAPLEIADDPARNTVRVKEHYAVPAFWQDGERDLWAHSITPYLARPSVERRRHGLTQDHPVQREHNIVVDVPGGWDIADEREAAASPAGTLVRQVSVRDRVLSLGFFYTSRAATIAPASVREHLDALDRMTRLARYGVETRRPGPDEDPATPATAASSLWRAAWTALGSLLAMALVAAVLARARRS